MHGAENVPQCENCHGLEVPQYREISVLTRLNKSRDLHAMKLSWCETPLHQDKLQILFSQGVEIICSPQVSFSYSASCHFIVGGDFCKVELRYMRLKSSDFLLIYS